MPDILFMFTMSFVEQITFLGSMYFFLNTPLKRCLCSPTGIVLNTISTFLMFYIQINFNHPYMFLNILPGMLQYTLTVKLVSRSKIKNCLAAVFCTYLFQFTFQSIPTIAILLLFPKFTVISSTLPTLVILILAGITTLLLYHFAFFKKVYYLLSENYILIFAVFIAVFLFFLTLSLSVTTLHVPENIGQTLTLFLSLIIFFIIFFVFFRIQKQKQMLHYYQTYLPVLNEMILNVRKNQHNHNNMIQSLYSLSQVSDKEHILQETIEKYQEHAASTMLPSKLLAFENKLFVALLYGKFESALEQGVHIEFQINSLSYKSRASEFEIVDLTGILLDNALEASHPGDTIFVEIGDPSGSFSITVKNPGPEATQDFIKQIFQENFTTKTNEPEKHGLGLSHLKAVVHKYHGQIEIRNEKIETQAGHNVLYLVLKIML